MAAIVPFTIPDGIFIKTLGNCCLDVDQNGGSRSLHEA